RDQEPAHPREEEGGQDEQQPCPREFQEHHGRIGAAGVGIPADGQADPGEKDQAIRATADRAAEEGGKRLGGDALDRGANGWPDEAAGGAAGAAREGAGEGAERGAEQAEQAGSAQEPQKEVQAFFHEAYSGRGDGCFSGYPTAGAADNSSAQFSPKR